MILIEIENTGKMQRVKNFEILRFPGENTIDLRRGNQLRRMRQPPDTRVRMLLTNRREDRRGTQHIACRAQLDDEDILGYGVVMLTPIAMHTLTFIRRAGYVASKLPTI